MITTTSTVPLSYCLTCFKQMDRATSFDGKHPKPDDFTLCFGCGALMCFNETLRIRRLTPADHARLATNPSVFAQINLHRNAIDVYRKQKGPAA